MLTRSALWCYFQGEMNIMVHTCTWKTKGINQGDEVKCFEKDNGHGSGQLACWIQQSTISISQVQYIVNLLCLFIKYFNPSPAEPFSLI